MWILVKPLRRSKTAGSKISEKNSMRNYDSGWLISFEHLTEYEFLAIMKNNLGINLQKTNKEL